MRTKSTLVLFAATLLAACGDPVKSDQETLDNTEFNTVMVEYVPRDRDEIRRSLGIPTDEEFMTRATTTTLLEYIEWDREWRDEPEGFRDHSAASEQLCDVLSEVGQDCWYHARGLLTQYLAYNGVNLFPCGTRSGNPYFLNEEACSILDPLDRSEYESFFIGSAEQNGRLAESVRQNTGLFEGGDLTPQAATQWKIVSQ